MTAQKIQTVLAVHRQRQTELAQLQDAHELASRTADDANRQAYQLNGEIAALNDRIDQSKRQGKIPDRSHLEQTIAQRDALLDVAERASSDRDQLNQAISTLQIAMQSPAHAAVAADDVVAIQSEREEKLAALSKVGAAIAAERARMTAAATDDTRVVELQRQLEDLLADGIDDRSQAAEIESVQSRLTEASAALQQDRETVAALTERAEQTIAGLERKRQSLQAELDGVTEAHRHAARLFLQTEMSTQRAIYLESGRALIEAFARMRGLELLSRDTAGIGAVRAFSGDTTMLDILQPFDPSCRREPGLRAAPDAADTALHRLRAEYEAAGLKLDNL